MVKGLAHVCFVVKSLEASRKFYCDGLGLKPAFEFRNARGERVGLYLHLGERTFIELFAGGPGAAAPDASFRHICIEVDDVAAEVARIRRAGIEIGDPKLGADRSWQAWLSDPDGNRIELHGYTVESSQCRFLSDPARPAAPVIV
jgi:catechol 2,3-dioxygenase-like lactoylglutathione lyase family enzyme